MSPPPLGKLLRFYRKRAGLTQAELAAKMSYEDGSLLSRLEQGKRLPGRDHLDLFIAALELSGKESQQLRSAYLSALTPTSPLPQPNRPDLSPPPEELPPTLLAPLTWAHLRRLCAEITGQRFFAAAQHKYQADLYWQRLSVRRAFDEFLASNRRCFVLLGSSGVGKSNFLLALAEELQAGSDNGVLMYDAAPLPVIPPLTELIGQDFKQRLTRVAWPAAEVWAGLARVDHPAGSYLILGIDALNEHPRPQALLRHLDELARSPWPWLKIILSCRPETWHMLRRSLTLAEEQYYRPAGAETVGIELPPFSSQELPGVYARYQQGFNLQTGYEALSGETREILRHPLSLFLTASSYERQTLPLSLKTRDLVDAYLRGLLRSGRLTEADLDWLAQTILPEMVQPNRYRNTVTLAYLEAAGNKRWFNHPALLNLLNAGILVRQDEGHRQKVAFQYERFYDYFVGRRLVAMLQAAPNRAEAYLNLLQQLPEHLFLWGAVQDILQTELQAGRLEIIEYLAERRLPLLEDILVGALITLNRENNQAAARMIEVMRHSPRPPVRKTAVAMAGQLIYLPILIQAAADTDSEVRLAAMRSAHLLWRRQPANGERLLAAWAAQIKWSWSRPPVPLKVIEVCLGATFLILTEPQQTTTTTTRQFLQTLWRDILGRLLWVNPMGSNHLARKLLQRTVINHLCQTVRRLLGHNLEHILAGFFPLPPERRPTFEKLLRCFELSYPELLRQEELLVEVMNWNDLVSVYVVDVILLLKLPRQGDQGLPLVERLFHRVLNVEHPLHSTGHLITAIYALVNREPGPLSAEAFTIYRDLVKENFDRTWGVYYTNEGEMRFQHGISLFSMVEWQKYHAHRPEIGLYALEKALLAPQPLPAGVLETLVRDTLLASSLVGHPHLTLAMAKLIFAYPQVWQHQPHLIDVVANSLATVRLYAPDEVEKFFLENNIPPTMRQLIYTREVTADQWWLKMFFPKITIFTAETLAQPGSFQEVIIRLLKAIPTCASLDQWLKLTLQELTNLIYEQPVLG